MESISSGSQKKRILKYSPSISITSINYSISALTFCHCAFSFVFKIICITNQQNPWQVIRCASVTLFCFIIHSCKRQQYKFIFPTKPKTYNLLPKAILNKSHEYCPIIQNLKFIIQNYFKPKAQVLLPNN